MRRRRKRRLSNLLLWAGLALLIAGFVARRTLAPRALDYLIHRPPAMNPAPVIEPPASQPPAETGIDRPQNAARNTTPDESVSDARTSPPQVEKPLSGSRENLSDSDRQQIDQILRRKAK